MASGSGGTRPSRILGGPEDLTRAYSEVPVLVVGAGGFIGSAVARALTEAGASVFALVRIRSRVEPELGRTLTGILVASLESPGEIRSAVLEVSPKITFNLAGYGVRRGEIDAKAASAVNAHGIEHIARAVAEIPRDGWEGARLVHVGSQAEYGPGVEMREESPCRPVGLYGRSKLEGTERLRLFSRSTGVPAVTARLFNVYGPGEPNGRLLPMLCQEAGGSGPVRLTSGIQERDFTFVTDVAEGLMRLGLLQGLRGDPVNLGTGRLTSVRRFVEIAAEELGISSDRLQFGALRDTPNEDFRPRISVDRLRDWTGWVPPTTVPEGVRRTVGAFRGRVPPDRF